MQTHLDIKCEQQSLMEFAVCGFLKQMVVKEHLVALNNFSRVCVRAHVCVRVHVCVCAHMNN